VLGRGGGLFWGGCWGLPLLLVKLLGHSSTGCLPDRADHQGGEQPTGVLTWKVQLGDAKGSAARTCYWPHRVCVFVCGGGGWGEGVSSAP
jgi:hypothetical protein